MLIAGLWILSICGAAYCGYKWGAKGLADLAAERDKLLGKVKSAL